MSLKAMGDNNYKGYFFTNTLATPTKFHSLKDVALERNMLSYCTQAAGKK